MTFTLVAMILTGIAAYSIKKPRKIKWGLIGIIGFALGLSVYSKVFDWTMIYLDINPEQSTFWNSPISETLFGIAFSVISLSVLKERKRKDNSKDEILDT